MKQAVTYHSSVRLIGLGYQKHGTSILGDRRLYCTVLQETFSVLIEKTAP
jgi:hypothetical protein